MLSSLLRQIVDKQPDVPKPLRDFYASHTTRRTTPSSDELRHILDVVSKDLHGLTIVVDALDECKARARQGFLSALETLREECDVRFLATSRFLPVIENHSAFRGKPRLEIKASDEDLEKYIRLRTSELHYQVLSKPDLLESIVANTISAAGGMCVRLILS